MLRKFKITVPTRREPRNLVDQAKSEDATFKRVDAIFETFEEKLHDFHMKSKLNQDTCSDLSV